MTSARLVSYALLPLIGFVLYRLHLIHGAWLMLAVVLAAFAYLERCPSCLRPHILLLPDRAHAHVHDVCEDCGRPFD
jgi:hypothetical protein